MENKNAVATPAPVNVAPATPANTEMKKEGLNMENSTRRLNRAAERRLAVAELRNAIIAAAPIAAAVWFEHAPKADALNAAAADIAAASSSLAVALSGKKNGEQVTVAPVPAAALIAACVTFTVKGTAKDNTRRIVWNVRKEGAVKKLFGVSSVERAADCKESAVILSEKDYLKEKAAPAERAAKKPLSPFEKLANSLYTAAKIAAKADFDSIPANIEKEFTFPAPADWKKENAALIDGTAALMNIKVN